MVFYAVNFGMFDGSDECFLSIDGSSRYGDDAGQAGTTSIPVIEGGDAP